MQIEIGQTYQNIHAKEYSGKVIEISELYVRMEIQKKDKKGGITVSSTGLSRIETFHIHWQLVEPEKDKAQPLPKCECGAKHIGIRDFAIGHYGFCPVYKAN